MINNQVDVLLLAPSNLIHMPYLNNYSNILDSLNIKYTVINWDRNHIEDISILKYRSQSVSIKKTFFEYRNYCKFLEDKIEELAPKKIIIFGIQLGFFLNKLLINRYKNKYIIDIRDKNLMMYFYNLNKFINNSKYTVISSEDYIQWLPRNMDYLINHNTNIDKAVFEYSAPTHVKEIKISTVGTIRDEKINLEFINAISRSENLVAEFYGDGLTKERLEKYVKKKRKSNILFYGRYNKDDEIRIINNSDFISVLRLPDSINNKSALPNRLYSGALLGKPLLAFEGTYLALIIRKFNIGIVIDSLDNLDIKLKDYHCWLIENWNEYLINREKFLKWVISDNDKFKKYLLDFLVD